MRIYSLRNTIVTAEMTLKKVYLPLIIVPSSNFKFLAKFDFQKCNLSRILILRSNPIQIKYFKWFRKI